MLRYLLVLVALSVSVKAQTTTSPAIPLPYEIRLDADFILTWGVSNNTITIDLYANTAGWLSMGLLSDDGNLLDVWWGGFDEDFGVPYLQDAYAYLNGTDIGPRYPDTVNNLNVINIVQPAFNATTRVRFSRPFITGDYKQDVDTFFDGTRQVILWALAPNDLPSTPSSKKGLAQVSWRP